MATSDASPLLSQLRPELAGASAYYVTGDDHLRVRSHNSLAGVALALEGRFLDVSGRIVPFTERHAPNSDRTEKSTLHTLGEGFLLNAMLSASAGSPKRGQCFACLELVRGRTGAVQPLACLLQGYVSAMHRLAWPGSQFLDSVEGRGAVRSVLGTDPAAGVEISEVVPTGARWLLHALTFTLVADGTAANRFPNVVIDDGATEIYRAASGTAQTAGQTVEYSAAAGGFAGGAGTLRYSLPLPFGLVLSAGFRIRTETTAIQAGDNYGAPQLGVEEWIEPA